MPVVLPPVSVILEGQGVPTWVQTDDRTLRLAREALSIYEQLAHPEGMISGIQPGEFMEVFNGDGRNEIESPVQPIAAAADDLSLFTVTVGEPVCAEISRLFRNQEFALAAMLDSTASAGVELIAQHMEDTERDRLKGVGKFHASKGIMRFSPGYCGWHISAQKKLFEYLGPDAVGMSLNGSFLMQPIKSISGVLVSGDRDIFSFDDTFSFCRDCLTHTCRDRMTALNQN